MLTFKNKMKKSDYKKSLAHLNSAMFYMGFGERSPSHPVTYCYANDYITRMVHAEDMVLRGLLQKAGSLKDGKVILNKNFKLLTTIMDHGDIKNEYVEEAIDRSNLILVTQDVSKLSDGTSHFRSIRGFALCTVSDFKLTLELIGNKTPLRLQTRTGAGQSTGKHIMNAVIELGKNMPDGIELWAVAWAISYYWDLGFRFEDGKTDKHQKHVQKLNDLLKQRAPWTYEALEGPLKHFDNYVKDRTASKQDQFEAGYRMFLKGEH